MCVSLFVVFFGFVCSFVSKAFEGVAAALCVRPGTRTETGNPNEAGRCTVKISREFPASSPRRAEVCGANGVKRKKPHPTHGGQSGRGSYFKPTGRRPAGLTKKAPETPPDARRPIGQSFLLQAHEGRRSAGLTTGTRNAATRD